MLFLFILFLFLFWICGDFFFEFLEFLFFKEFLMELVLEKFLILFLMCCNFFFIFLLLDVKFEVMCNFLGGLRDVIFCVVFVV